MYQYRNSDSETQAWLLAQRREREFPLHAPPHFDMGQQTYLLTAACFEHKHIMSTEQRRFECLKRLLSALGEIDANVFSWVVLANHYHLLARVDLNECGEALRRVHSGLASRWNRQDSAQGRQVWYRFSDRRIRNADHYGAALNYIHANPVKHDYVENARDWPTCSLQHYLETQGRERLEGWWHRYPIRNMGRGWDDF